VVIAGNIHLGTLMPRLAATLMPVTTYVLVTNRSPSLPILCAIAARFSDTERGRQSLSHCRRGKSGRNKDCNGPGG